MRLGTFQAITVGASYSLGCDTSNAGGPGGTNCAGENGADAQRLPRMVSHAALRHPNWGLTSAYDRKNGGAGAAAGFTGSDLGDSRMHLARTPASAAGALPSAD